MQRSKKVRTVFEAIGKTTRSLGKLGKKFTSGKITAALFCSILPLSDPTALSRSIEPTKSENHTECRVTGNRLSYDRLGQKAGINLDVKVVGKIEDVICSDPYSVIITEDNAVVTMGRTRAIEGATMLGQVGEIFTGANSYKINIKKLRKIGIERVEVVGGQLLILTKDYTLWIVDLSNPKEWGKTYNLMSENHTR
ncbi:hypothetical protein HZC07_01625 [Candidatus Micrarchaeota archaeon]|nr:hypothetical protein [Candidatus Micrarchaeota archaeon]